MHKLDEALEHSGVKGMKWGIRRNYDRPGGADGKTDPKGNKALKEGRSKIGKRLDSMKRERQWGKVLHEIDKMSTVQMNTVKKRIQNENDLKALSKSKMATKKDREDYLRRGDMSDQELSRKITRLRAKNNLHDEIKKATKEQREFGIKVAQVGGTLGFKYATSGGRPLGPKDVFDAVTSPTIKTKQDVLDNAIKIADGKVSNKHVKNALKGAKDIKIKSKKD